MKYKDWFYCWFKTDSGQYMISAYMALCISFVMFSVLQTLLQIDSLKDLTSINFASIKGNLRKNVHHRKKNNKQKNDFCCS